MQTIQDLVQTGAIVNVILVVMLAELAVSASISRRRNLFIDLPGLSCNIGAGASLAMALKAALTDAGWTAIAVWLVASLVFHGLDVARRWQLAKPR